MKYRVTETERYYPDYSYHEDFETHEEAYDRMLEMYRQYYEEPAVENAEFFENSAYVELNDTNCIEWEITEINE